MKKVLGVDNATVIDRRYSARVRIVSGGQTGVDRAALDLAIKRGIECGGWCPAGRLDELGRIPDRYPVQELEQGTFDDRTLANVQDSDGTAVIHFGVLRGGTTQTIKFALEHHKPHIAIDAQNTSPEEAAKRIADLIKENQIEILNVAGPRQSQWPGGYDYAFRALEIFLTRSATLSPDRVARRNTRE